MIDNLLARGLDPTLPRLFIVDGAKALSKAIRNTFGVAAAIQRCQVHKGRNIGAPAFACERQEGAPSGLGPGRRRQGRTALRNLARRLEHEEPGVSGSILEGLDEILTVIRLGLPHRIRLPNSLTQPSLAAAVAAIADTDHIGHYRKLNAYLRARFVAAASALGLEPVPGHGNFVLVRFPGGPDQAATVYRDMKDNGVMLRPMGGYGLDDCLRVTLGAEAELAIAVERLGEAVRADRDQTEPPSG